MTDQQRIRQLLNEGPATTVELCHASGIKLRRVTAIVNKMKQTGNCKPIGAITQVVMMNRKMKIYSLTPRGLGIYNRTKEKSCKPATK